MHGELVAGEVLGVEAHGLFQGFQPTGLGLAGQAVHEVEPHLCKASAFESIERLHGLIRRVPALQKTEILIVKGLHTQTDAVDTQIPKSHAACLKWMSSGFTSTVNSVSSREGKACVQEMADERLPDRGPSSRLGVPPPRYRESKREKRSLYRSISLFIASSQSGMEEREVTE